MTLFKEGLTRINYSKMTLADAQINTIIKALETDQLQYLDLTGATLTAAQQAKLIKPYEANTSLVSLKLKGIDVGANSLILASLISGLKNKCNLTQLTIDFEKLTKRNRCVITSLMSQLAASQHNDVSTLFRTKIYLNYLTAS